MVYLLLCIKNQPVNRKNIYSNLITNILWGGLRIHWWQIKLSLHNVPNMHENAKTYPRSLSLQHNCWEESSSHAVAVVYYHFLNRSSVYALMAFFFFFQMVGYTSFASQWNKRNHLLFRGWYLSWTGDSSQNASLMSTRNNFFLFLFHVINNYDNKVKSCEKFPWCL